MQVGKRWRIWQSNNFGGTLEGLRTMTNIVEVKEQVLNVARVRAELQEAIEAKRAAMAKWEEEHTELIGKVKTLSETKEEYEARLRELALAVYNETENKKPCEGVGIREITRLEYEMEFARDWAMEHKMALKLDVVAFEKIARVDPPSFVTIEVIPQATIATDLTEVLKLEV